MRCCLPKAVINEKKLSARNDNSAPLHTSVDELIDENMIGGM